MADYYTQFSIGVDLRTDAEKEWCIQAERALMEILELVGTDETQRLEELSKQYEPFAKLVADGDDGFLGFEMNIYKPNETVKDSVGHLWITSDEAGNVDQVGIFLQMFIQKFRPTEAIAFTWANTCSKPREDGFDGGAMFITATELKYMSAYQWCEEQWKEFNKGQDKNP